MRLALAAVAAGVIAAGAAIAAGSSGREASRVAPTKAGGEIVQGDEAVGRIADLLAEAKVI